MLRKFIPLPILAGLFIAASFVMSAPVSASYQAQATPTLDHDANVNGGDDHDADASHADEHGERIDAGDASIRILSPADGAMISEPSALIRVETTNYLLGEGKHWHLYVDGNSRGMSQGNSDTMAATDLEPGEHVIEVVLSNEQHQELDATDTITIHVEVESHAAAGASSDNSLLIVGAIVVGIAVVAGAGYLSTRRK
jgi:hypothetical protein